MHETVDGITRAPVDSTLFDSIGYSAERQVLAIGLRNGDIRHYKQVPPELHTQFLEAESLGKFYNHRIKGKFGSDLMTGPCNACGIKGIVGEKCAECGCGKHVAIERRYEPTEVDQLTR